MRKHPADISVSMRLNALAEEATFDLNAEVKHVNLVLLNNFLQTPLQQRDNLRRPKNNHPPTLKLRWPKPARFARHPPTYAKASAGKAFAGGHFVSTKLCINLCYCL